jgi:hypothetical protein
VKLTELVQRAVGVVDGGQGTHPAVHILADDQIRRMGLGILHSDRPWYTQDMREPRSRAVRVRTFHPEDQEALLEETILEWRALGAAAAWNAVYDMLDWWFAARGLDPEAQRVERTHLELHPVPWLAGNTTTEAGDVVSSNQTARA